MHYFGTILEPVGTLGEHFGTKIAGTPEVPRGTFLGTSHVRQFGPTRAANNRAHNSSFSPAGCAPSSAPGPSPSRAGGSHFVPAVSTNAHNPFLLPTGPAARPNGGEATPLRPNPSNTPSAPRHSSRRAGVGSAVFVRAAQANAHNPFLHASGDVTNCGPQMRRPACSANLAPGRDCRTDG